MGLEDRLRRLEENLKKRQESLVRGIDDRLAETERRIADTLEGTGAIDVQTPSGIQRVPLPQFPPRLAKVDLSAGSILRTVDEVMDKEFDVQGYLGGSLAVYPTTFCETVREYVVPILADLPISEGQRSDLIGQIEEAAEAGQVPPILQSLGVHIPGVGCFINGWYLGRLQKLAPRALFTDPEGFGRIVTTASHEKWGHGFITDLTTLGKEKAEVQLQMNHLAEKFEVRTVDTPEHARLLEQWSILFKSSQYVEEGFASWVERYLAERLAERGVLTPEQLQLAPRFSLESVLQALSGIPQAQECSDALQSLFDPGEPTIEHVHEAMTSVGDGVDVLGDIFPQAIGMPAPYVVGYCIAEAIAQRQGPKCVPYAVATACNIQYGLKTISNHDLANYVKGHPTLNVNTRLALQMFVSEGTQNDVRGFVTRVRDEVGLIAPLR